MKRKIRMILYIVLIFILLIVISLLVCNGLVNHRAAGRTYQSTDSIPYNKVGLVLGTSPILASGAPNPYYVNRIEAAAELYKNGKISYFIVSGDNHVHTYNEPDNMKEALQEKGIPEDRIYADYAGFRTLDSVIRADKIFGQKQITIISQRFHNERAIYLADWYGVDAIGYNARDVGVVTGLKTRIRETFARVKVFVDILTHKKPKFLGEEIHIP